MSGRPALATDAHWRGWPADLERRYREEGVWTDDLLGDVAVPHARQRPDALAVADPRGRLTYAELEQQVSRLAGALQARTVRGDRVIVQLPNCTEFVVALLAMFRAGVVPVMALPAHRQHEIGYFVEHAQAAAVLTADRVGDFDQVALVERLRHRHPDLQHWVVPGAGRPAGDAPVEPVAGDPAATRTWDDLLTEGDDADQPPADVRAQDLALLQLSGGSTGVPKLIPRTHRDYHYSVRRSVELCDLGPDAVQLTVLPCAHNFALSSAGVLGALLSGAATVMAPEPSPGTCFPLIQQHGVTIAGVVPPVALLWLAAAERAEQDLSSLRVLQVGGAKLSQEAARRVGPVLGCRLQQVFGMAEGLVNYTRADDDDDVVVHTQGRPMSALDEVEVRDDDDHPVPDGTPGHLVVQGPYTIRGYYRAPEQQSRSFTGDGRYRTGDLVVRRPDGSLTVVGRAKEQINRGGEKIATEEVENHLLAHPAVHEASVVGEEDRMLGERVVAHLVLTESVAAHELSELANTRALARVRGYLAERGLATYKLPDRLRIVTELPRTGVGKTSTKDLRAAADQTAPTA